MLVRRTRYLRFRFVDNRSDDDLSIRNETSTALYSWSALDGQVRVIPPLTLAALSSISSEGWSEVPPEDEQAVLNLATMAYVITDNPDEPYLSLRTREEAFYANLISPDTAITHAFGEQAQIEKPMVPMDYDQLLEQSHAAFQERIEILGPPPPMFHSRTDDGATHLLPIPDQADLNQSARYLTTLFRARHATRHFQDKPVSIETLAQLLFFIFVPHSLEHFISTRDKRPVRPPSYYNDDDGLYRLVDDAMTVLHRSHASGGARHPYEAYLLVRSVTTLEPGLYRYDCEQHTLKLHQLMEPHELNHFAATVPSGQGYAKHAPILLLLTRRPLRHTWKYSNEGGMTERAIPVMDNEAGQLAGYIWLLATALDLGCIYTGAIDSRRGNEQLGIDGAGEDLVGILALGYENSRGNRKARHGEVPYLVPRDDPTRLPPNARFVPRPEQASYVPHARITKRSKTKRRPHRRKSKRRRRA